MAWRSLPGRRGSRWLGRFSMLPKVLSGHPETPDTSFSDAAQSDAGRGAASRALCLLPSQMRAGAQRAMPCVCCLVRCGQGCSKPCPVSAARSDAGRDTASRALCLLPGQMQAGTQQAVPCVCRHLWGVQLRGRGSVLDALQHLSALGGGHLQRSGGASEHGNRVSSSEGLKWGKGAEGHSLQN